MGQSVFELVYPTDFLNSVITTTITGRIVQVSTPYIFLADEVAYINQIPPYLDYIDPSWPGTLTAVRAGPLPPQTSMQAIWRTEGGMGVSVDDEAGESSMSIIVGLLRTHRSSRVCLLDACGW